MNDNKPQKPSALMEAIKASPHAGDTPADGEGLVPSTHAATVIPGPSASRRGEPSAVKNPDQQSEKP